MLRTGRFTMRLLSCVTRKFRGYHKIELPNYGVFDEKRYFFPGLGCFVFEMHGSRIAVTICEDIWIPGSVVETCSLKNEAEIVPEHIRFPILRGQVGCPQAHRDSLCNYHRDNSILQ